MHINGYFTNYYRGWNLSILEIRQKDDSNNFIPDFVPNFEAQFNVLSFLWSRGQVGF
jgi:hypothetical protein